MSSIPRYHCFKELFQSLKNRSSSIALLAPDRIPLSCRELCRQIEYTVSFLNAHGLGRDNRIGVILPDGPEMAMLFLSCIAGGAFVPLKPDDGEQEYNLCISDLRIDALVVGNGSDSTACFIARKMGIPIIALTPLREAEAGLFSLEWISGDRRRGCRTGFARPDDIALVLETSGSTSCPKVVPLSQDTIFASAHYIGSSLHLTGKDRCLNIMPMYHIAGLVSPFLASLSAGGSVICTAGFSPERFFDSLKMYEPTWYSAVPTIHQSIIERAEERSLNLKQTSLRFVRSTSFPLFESVFEKLENTFNLPVIQTFGLTEALPVASTPMHPYKRKPMSVGIPVSEVAIVDENGAALGNGTGEIVVRGPQVFKGYENSPEATSTAFFDGWFRTGDLGYFDEEGFLYITGRLKETINRGGQKVSPQEVEAVLMSHPAVREAVVFGIAHPRLGEAVASVVVPEASRKISEGELRRYSTERLAPFKVPQHIILADSIPKGPAGKFNRTDLAQKFVRLLRPDLVPPATELEIAIAKFWQDVLGINMIGKHDNFFAIGGDSLLGMQVLSLIKKHMEVSVPVEAIFQNTLEELAEVIAQSQYRRNNPAQAALLRENLETAPLSFAQQRLWFLQQLDPGSAVYNVPLAFQIEGELNETALVESLQEIVRRHEVLRTTFSVRDGIPVQVAHAATPLNLMTIDLRDHPDCNRENEAKKLIHEALLKPFDLLRGPLIRASLLKLTDQKHIFFLITHHIVFDAWSSGIFFRELSAIYRAFSELRPPALDALSIQYADFVMWERQLMQGEALQKQLDYWKKQLDGAPPIFELPTDRPRPLVQSFRGARQTMKIPQDLSRALRELSRREDATLYMTLLAVFKTLLYRYTGQEDIVVGSPVANRTTVESEKLIGFFVNNLLIRTHMSGNSTFQELLKDIRHVAREAFSHQDLPFEKLVEEIRPERTMTHSPLFQVMFALQNVPGSAVSLPGLEISRMDVYNGAAKFDMILFMNDTEDGLTATLEYNIDLFEEHTAIRLLEHYQNLLFSIVADPSKQISALPMLTKTELQKLLVEWTDTKTDYPRNACIHELFEYWSKHSPETVAACFERNMQYGELNRSSNQVAHYLQRLGISPNNLVGICMERTTWMIIGMIGILKAGGAYVPLDPTYPKERLFSMAEDAGLSMVLSSSSAKALLHGLKTEVLYIDECLPLILQEKETNPVNLNTPEDLSYVIYTSGSTGTSKGVSVSHRAVVRLVCNTNYIDIMPEDKIAQISNVSFDASTFEIWGALLNGAGLVAVDRDTSVRPQEFAGELQVKGITILFLTTALFNLIARTAPYALQSLHTVLFGGEAVDVECVRHVLGNGRPARLLHVYGPTENTTFSTWYEIQSVSDDALTIPIGRPIANTTTYVFSRDHALVPFGGLGMLFLGGDGLSKGYLNRTDLNKTNFIHNPYSNDPANNCLFRTGDLVRLRSDGNLEFFGRIDRQTKIRGFRVEPSETEAVLRTHDGILDAVVVSGKDITGNNCLVSYVVPKQKDSFESIGLRTFLQSKVPAYMIPSSFIALNIIPLTPNGKIDYQSLPEPLHENKREVCLCSNPSKLEQDLIRIWEGLLKISIIGTRDNFFDLGGHSLMIVRLFSEIEKAFGIKIPPSVIFQASTIEQLAALINNHQQLESVSCLVTIRPGESRPPLFCVAPVTGSALLYHLLAKYLDPDQPVSGIDSSEAVLSSSLEETAAKYIDEIRKKMPDGPFLLLGFSSGGIVAFEMARQLHTMNLQVPFLAVLDTACIGYSKEKVKRWELSMIEKTIENFPFWLYYYLPFWLEHYWKIGMNKLHYVLNKTVGYRASSEEVVFHSQKVINWLKKYTPQKYPGPITFYRAKAQALFPSQPDKGWGNFADSIDIRVIPGNHLDIVTEPHVRVLADDINRELRRIWENA